MKKYLLVLILIYGGLYGYAQSLKNIKTYTLLKQYDKAKPEVDNFLKDEKNAATAEAWYYKAYIYNSLSRAEEKVIAERAVLNSDAFEAIIKYAKIDPKAPLTTEEKNSTVFNIYYGFYDLGVKTYNTKNYSESFDLFKKALDVHDYIYDNKLTGPSEMKFAAHDTDVVWNLAVLANQLNNKEAALVYYKKIADVGLSDEKYSTAYDELVIKYKKEKNAELFTKYVQAAKKYYPIDKLYWENQEIDFATADLEDQALLNKYEELTKTLPDNYIVFYNYAITIDQYLTSKDIKGKELSDYRAKMVELFKKAISLKSTIEANLQLSNMYYSKTYDLQEQVAKIKGTKPDEIKLKNELNATIKSTMTECIPYAEEALTQLAALKEYKFADKANYKLTLEILSNANKLLGNTAKVAEYDKKRAEVDNL